MGRAQGEAANELPALLPGRKHNLLEQAIAAVLEEHGWTESWDLYLAAQHHLRFRLKRPGRITQERFENTINRLVADGLSERRLRPVIGSEDDGQLRPKEEFNLVGADPQNDYVHFGEIADAVGMQSQYASRYIDGWDGSSAVLGNGLRIKGSVHDYHTLKMQREDAQVFYERLRDHRKQVLSL